MSGTEGAAASVFNGCSWYDDRGVLVMNVSQAERITAALTAERDELREQVARVEALAEEAELKARALHVADPARWYAPLVDAADLRAAIHPTDGAS